MPSLLDEVTESAKSQFVERMASPLLGSFAISWALWNYKFFVILFSAASVSQTFKLIETLVFPDWWAWVSRGLLLPLSSSLVYLFGYPYPARFVYEATRKHGLAMDELRKKYDGMELLTLEKSRKLRAEIALADAAHKAEIDRLNEIIADLKGVQSELAKSKLVESEAGLNETQRYELAAMQPDSMLNPNMATKITLPKDVERVLNLFAGEDDVLNERLAVDDSGIQELDAKYALGELEKHGFLRRHETTDGPKYALTHEGRGWLRSRRARH